MVTTLRLRDYLLRPLVNATPGTSDATDYNGRAIKAGNVDFMDRALVGTAWAISTVVAVGDYTVLSTGETLVATVAGTTSGTTEPTAPGHDQTVVDGTVTWRQVTA